MAEPQFFTAKDGARLAFRDEGAGLPVLCLAGLTRGMSDFDDMMPHLLPCRIIRMDYRGRGASDWTGAPTYTVAQEGLDALALLDHLGIDRAAIIGTSRGGLIGMHLATFAAGRMRGLLLNDIGPEINRAGLMRIFDYVGRNPAARTHDELAARLPAVMTGFANVPAARWLAEARKLYDQTPQGLKIRYDPALRDSFLAGFDGPAVDRWPAFDAMHEMPVALIRGANSDLLTQDAVAEMRRRRPDMIFADVPDRAHIPFLDEPEAVQALHLFQRACHDH